MKRKYMLLAALVFSIAMLIPKLGVNAEINPTVTGMEVSVPSAILMDAKSGEVLFEKNSHEQRPCASITKVMTLCLAFEAIEEGKFTLEDTLSASARAASMGGSDIWLKEGELMTVDDLLKATVIMSANDASVVLAEAVAGSEEAFIAMMNEKAKNLGMADTVFKNCNGLDEDGHVTSAYDVAIMSRELIKHEKIFDYTLTWIDYLRGGETQLVNTNKLIKSYNGITGLKTGTTSKAGSCITATAERNSLSLISVVLGASSTDERFKDAAAMLDYGFANWTVTTPEAPVIEDVEVKGGMVKKVKAEAAPAPQVLMKASEKGDVNIEINMKKDIEAPVEAGDILGKVSYKVGGKTVAETEIKALEAAPKITLKSSFFYLLGNIFSK